MTVTAVDIYNLALQEVGAKRVDAITDSTKGAEVITVYWDFIRDELLSKFPWNFAIEQDELVQTDDPLFGYENAYTLPTDCLKVLKMSLEGYDYRIAGGTLEIDLDYADLGEGYEVEIEYIKQVTDPDDWSPGFRKCMALALAAAIAVPMTSKRTLAELMEQKFQVAFAEATGIDWNQDNETPVDVSSSANSWISARG